jgi:Cys-rich protein (TIGR01571 family)
MLYAQLKQRLNYLNLYAKPDPFRGGSGVDVNCMLWALLYAVTGCGFVLQAVNRGQLRNRYTISGDGCNDFCVAWCCTPCSLTQEHRELELEEQTLRQ